MLSIIIPVFNVEMCLSACIDSILKQQYTNFELILIDDGSMDGSGCICDAYVAKDNRIIVIHQENQGVSVARNVGLERAKGEYITFVDADDEISSDFCSNVVLFEKYPELDLIFISPTIMNTKQIYRAGNKERIFSTRKEIYECMLDIKGMFGVCWGMIFKKAIYFDNKNAIKFPIGQIRGQDLAIYLNILKRTQCLYVSTQGFYNYCFRKNSASHLPWQFVSLYKIFQFYVDLFSHLCEVDFLLTSIYKCDAYMNIVILLRKLNIIQNGYIKLWVQKCHEPRLALKEIMQCPLSKMKIQLLFCYFIGFVRFCTATSCLLRLWLYLNPDKFVYEKQDKEIGL